MTTPNVTHPFPTYRSGGIDGSRLREYLVVSTMTEARGDRTTTESEELANEFEKMMRSTNLSMSPRCCIFKVPNILERNNPKAYAPNAFSIGPYHYGKEHLQATQKIKLKYLQNLISRSPRTDPKTMLKTLTRAVSEVEQVARDCYAEPFDHHISRDEFLKILLLDGCFLIELFRKNADEDLRKDHDDPVFTRTSMLQLLNLDLILVENQIPWFVLELLFGITTKDEDLTRPLSSLVLRFNHNGVNISRLPNFRKISEQLRRREHENKHILDLLRNSLLLSSSTTRESTSLEGQSMASAAGYSLMDRAGLIKFKMGLKSLFGNMISCLEKRLSIAPKGDKSSHEEKSMPSATRLREAGIKFQQGKSSASIFDVTFKDGILEIPPLNIQETADSLFRNLICFEQCLPNCDLRFTSYAILLDKLINTTEDMEILCDGGIIYSWLNIEDSTEYFNKLYHGTFSRNFYYRDLIQEVNEYCRRSWPRYRAVLMRDYFKHPWALVSVIAASILLILTVAQTVFAIIKK